MELLQFPRAGEKIFHEVLENGLNVFVFPKPEFQKSYAFFATRYGGMDTRFCLNGQWQDTPAGIAHYLEHKMFDTEEGNALQDLAANGASPNAFTSNAITGYYFECTEKFEENLKILLSFVSVPWFTPESVAKEQGIIGQEIGMIEDDPNWQVYQNLTKAMYHTHPIRTSVAGTVESISHITDKTLYDCHKAFYDPANMVLCAAGDLDLETVCAAAREILPKTPGPIADRDYGGQEPEQVSRNQIEISMEVSTPIFQLGFKGDAPAQGEAGLRQSLLGELACEALLGTSSPLYARLYREGLINKSFYYDYETEPGCSFLCAGGESRDPEAVRAAVLEESERLVREGVDCKLWERIKKGCYGNRMRSLNSFENLCVTQAQSFFREERFLDFPQIYESLTVQDVQGLLERWVVPSRTALSIVRPKGGETA